MTTSLCAIIPAANLQAANATLEAAGFGPNNFSAVSFSNGRATHAAMHAWNDPAFSTAVKALPGVAYDESEGDPVSRTKALIEAQGAQWGANAPPLTGEVIAGKLYRHTDDSLWWVIQSYNATAQVGFPDPTIIPALVRRARRPGVAEPWVQPLGAGYEYKLVDPFTGQPETCAHAGAEWATVVDNNVWQPGVYGWDVISGTPQIPEPPQTPEWAVGVLYAVNSQVTYSGKTYKCLQAHTSQAGWTPAAVPALWQMVG